MTNIEGDVVLGVVENNDQYLIVRRSATNSSSGKWVFPGGKIEENERPEEAVKREVKEETNLEVEVIKSGDTFFNTGELGTWRIHPFLVKSSSRDAELNHEHDRYEWINISDLENFDTLGKVKAPEKLDLD